MTENYLVILEESLRRKLQVLEDIQAYNMRQQEIFQADNVDLDQFDSYVDEKGMLIDRLNSLDNGFERLYANVAEELSGNREKYVDQIRRLQELVSKVTEAGVQVQAQEARNKKLIEDYFRKQREGIRDGRKSSKAAYDYYKNMSKSSVVMPQIMDQKK
ncbi:MAG: flagellar export chaperone FlgN [Acetatifactor sp.]|nr:flagellar export chaperone FlgN [Acetatifactor sp.]MDE7354033.1 flagellar export chaperone FlgN [Acetatifactor sp.]